MDALSYTEDRCVSPAASPKSVGFPPMRPASTFELVQLGQLLETLLSVAHGLGNNQHLKDARGVLNEAGERFDEVTEAICNAYISVMGDLRDSRPLTRGESEDKACELLKFDLGCDQDVTDAVLPVIRARFRGRY